MLGSVNDTKSVFVAEYGVCKRKVCTLKKRSEFIHVSQGVYRATPSFVLQCQNRVSSEESHIICVGYTATKRVGNAVIRNRAKRRLRALAAEMFPLYAESAYNYVLIARKDATILVDFQKMRADLQKALSKVHSSIAQRSI